MKITAILLLCVTTILPSCYAQSLHNFEFSGGWVHVTGNNGLDGVNPSAALWFTPRVQLAFDYDRMTDTTPMPAFALTNLGLITVKSHMDNYLVGPRVFFHSKNIHVLRTLHPFAEFEAGATHLRSTITQVGTGSQSASDNAGSWMLGGGGDVLVSPRWACRVNLGLLRTHLVNSAQSRLRVGLGVAYTFGSRKVE